MRTHAVLQPAVILANYIVFWHFKSKARYKKRQKKIRRKVPWFREGSQIGHWVRRAHDHTHAAACRHGWSCVLNWQEDRTDQKTPTSSLCLYFEKENTHHKLYIGGGGEFLYTGTFPRARLPSWCKGSIIRSRHCLRMHWVEISAQRQSRITGRYVKTIYN